MFDFSTLITDRAAADLENLRALLSTPMEDWTAEQLAAFNQAASKGAYNYTDLNRVTAAMDAIHERLTALGYQTGYQPIIVHQKEPEPVNPLPEGYTQLEYIQSTGAQYILTDVIPNNDTYMLAKVATTQSSQCGMVVCDENWQKNGCGFWGNAAAFGNQTIQDLQLYDGNPHTIEIQSGTITIDGSAVLTYAGPQFSGVCPLSICALNRAGVISEKTAMTVWQLVINDHQYVPCSTPANEVGLYDTEYGVFYGNNGSGSFVAGPEVPPPPEPEPQDPYTWYETDVPTQSEMAQYLSNVLSVVSVFIENPQLPQQMTGLTVDGANQIESALLELWQLIEILPLSFVPCGEALCGGDNL